MATKKQSTPLASSVKKSAKVSTTSKAVVKKKMPSKAVIEAGSSALEKWRSERAAAKAKGPRAYAEWEAKEKLKREQKKTTPMMAIKNFCIACVDSRKDITNCTSFKCPLYIYRPYQNGVEE